MASEAKQTKKKGIARVTYISPDNFQPDDVHIEDELQLHHLEQLMYWFRVHRPPAVTHQYNITGNSEFSIPIPIKQSELRKPGLLTLEEFSETLVKVLGNQVNEKQLGNLFNKLDASGDGYVDWNEFCTYMLLQFRERDYIRAIRIVPFQNAAEIRHIVPNKQETTTKILSIDSPTKIITFSKEGSMCVWSSGLHLEKTYTLNESDSSLRNSKRRVKEWITDAVYMVNCRRLAIASTGRDIRFYDATTNDQYYEESYLYGLPDVPVCLTYWYNEKVPSGRSLLLYGDDHGTIHALYFSKPLRQMFAVPFKKEEGVQKIYFPDLSGHSEWVTYIRLDTNYSEPIRRIIYLPENDYIAVCTSDSRYSMVLTGLSNRKKSYVFSLTKGIDCFDYNKTLNSIVTGSSDHMVRLWNPYVTTRPVAILMGHNMNVVDVKIYEALSQVFSYSRDAVLKVWDMKEYTCLQTIAVKFPNSQLGRLPEYGAFPMTLHLSPKSVLLTANDYIAMLKLGQVSDPVFSSQPMTHKAQLCGAAYNQHLKQVVTAADDSTIGVWEVETGAKQMMFTGAHGREEISCFIIDATGRRLITGARDGTIKVWNIQNGHNLHQLEAVDDSEVTGIIHVPDKKAILTVGWSRKIVLYSDTEPDNVFIKANTDWKGGHGHKEDILAAAICPPTLLATASFDGEILVWFLETEALFKKLRKTRPVRTSAKISALTGGRKESGISRPNSKHKNNHRLPSGHAAPVDMLIFLLARAEVKQSESAILVSSEAGLLRWWSVYGKKTELGNFYACDQKDECILGMCTNRDNSLLITGDTQGKITVWNTASYCVAPDDPRNHEQPDVVTTWSGHSNAVVSLEVIYYDEATYLLSSSTDTTAKLWTLDGLAIGTFGQKKQWLLGNPLTWNQPPKWAIEAEEKRTMEFLRSRLMEGPKEDGVDNSRHSSDEGKDVTADPKSDFPKLQRKVLTIGPGIPQTTLNPMTDEGQLQDRSKTFTFGSNWDMNGKIGLGKRANNQLARVRHDRQGRREHMKGIDFSRTNRYGTLQCCAYQAMHIPELEEVQNPENFLSSSQNALKVTTNIAESNPKTAPVKGKGKEAHVARSRNPSSISVITGATTVSNGRRLTAPRRSNPTTTHGSYGSQRVKPITN